MAEHGLSTGTQSVGREADEIVARLDRLPFTSLHRRACGVIALGSFFDSFDALLLASAIAVVISVLHISFLNIGLLISAANFGMMIGAPFGGWLAEKFGRRPVLMSSIAGFGLLSVASAFAWDFSSLLTIRFIEGLALGAEIPVAAALFNEFIPGRRRARAFLYGFGTLFAAGFLFAPLAGLGSIALFGPALGWRVLFGCGGLAIIVAAAMYFMLPESPRWLASKGRMKEAKAIVEKFEMLALADGKELPPLVARLHVEERPTRVAELFSPTYRSRTILIWILFFVTYFVAYGIAAWLPTLYVRVGGLPTDQALSLTVLYGLTQVVVVFFWGTVADRLGRRRVYIIALALLAFTLMAGFVVVAWLNFTAWPVLAVVAFVAGIGNGATSSLSFLYASELFPTRMRAWAAATCTSANRIGTVLAPGAIGALLAADLGLGSVFLMVSCVAFAGLICVIVLAPETGTGTLEEASAEASA